MLSFKRPVKKLPADENDTMRKLRYDIERVLLSRGLYVHEWDVTRPDRDTMNFTFTTKFGMEASE